MFTVSQEVLLNAGMSDERVLLHKHLVLDPVWRHRLSGSLTCTISDSRYAGVPFLVSSPSFTITFRAAHPLSNVDAAVLLDDIVVQGASC